MDSGFTNRLMHWVCVALLSLAALPVWAQWSTTEWMADPVLTDSSNPGWVAGAAREWNGEAPRGITLDSARDSKRSREYKKKDTAAGVSLQITPADRAVIRTSLEHASELLEKQGFKAPLLEKQYGYWRARIFPDHYIYDQGIRNTSDHVWGMYLSHKDPSGATGRLYVAQDWRDDKGMAFIHELFHAVGSAYLGHNRQQSDKASRGCSVPCWITEGMAEGFTAYWAELEGSKLLNEQYSRDLRRSYERSLATKDYGDGQATASFWHFVAGAYGLQTLHDVLNHPPTIDDNALFSTDAGLRAAGHGGLSPVFVRFVSTQLKSPGYFDTIPLYKLSKDEPHIEKDFTIEKLAARAFRIQVKLDKGEEGQLSIDATDGGNDAMHLLIDDRVYGAEATIPLATSQQHQEFFVRLVNARPNATETVEQQLTVAVSLDILECGMMPSKRVRNLYYEQFDANGTAIAKIEYDFSKANYSRRAIDNVRMIIDISGDEFGTTNEATFSYRCTEHGVVSNGTYAMHGMKLPSISGGKAQGSMTLKQEHNTLSLPNHPVMNKTLPDGSAAFSAGFDGAPGTRITVHQTDRKIAGRELIKVAGAGDLNAWKMISRSSFNMDINAAGLLGSSNAPAHKGTMDFMEEIMKLSGKGLSAGDKSVLNDAIAQVGQSGLIEGLMSGLSGAITQQASGQETIWFYPGIGMVKHQSSNAQAKNKVQLTKVRYR